MPWGRPASRAPPPSWRGSPGARRPPLLLLLGVAPLGLQHAAAVYQSTGSVRSRAGRDPAAEQDADDPAAEPDGEEAVLYGNGDDLPGFGAYHVRRRGDLQRDHLPPGVGRLAALPSKDHGHLLTVPGFTWEKQGKWSRASMPAPTAAVKRFLFLLSIVIAFCGSTLTVMGMVLQKYAHQKASEEADLRHDEEDDDKDRLCMVKSRHCYLFNCRWILGLAIFAAGNAMTWVALGMGPNSVLACFNSWNIVCSMIVAPMWFGERVAVSAKLSAVVLIGGCVWVTIAGPRSYRLHTIDSINMLFARFPFTLCCIICLTMLVAAKIKHWFWKGARNWSAWTSVQITSMASIFACYAVLFSKCTSMLVQSSVVSNVSQIGYWQFYLWAGATVVCGICQIYFLNESLRHGYASFVIPAYESMGMALQIVVGGIFFREYRKFTLSTHMKFWPGVLLVMSGLLLLTRSVGQTDPAAERQASAKAGDASPEQKEAAA